MKYDDKLPIPPDEDYAILARVAIAVLPRGGSDEMIDLPSWIPPQAPTYTSSAARGRSTEMTEHYPEPTPEMLGDDPLFEAIWQAIKGWDISRHNDGLYSTPSGNDVRHIYDAVIAGAA